MDEEVRVSGISISTNNIRLPKDMTTILEFAISPYNATNQGITWSSSNDSIVTVDADGKIRGVSEGFATITVTTDDGGYTDSCDVTVTQPVTHVTANNNIYEHTPSSNQTFYDANYVTCYPGSNQSDDGKINLEFNMARLVTRITSKNFCVTRPAFELTKMVDISGSPMVEVGSGQASINGMDLIITQSVRIHVPEEEGDYYLALHLWRDSSSNVLGDLTVGVTKQFKGVYLDWFRVRDEFDDDALWLGKIHFDGTSITSIEEDQEKYGRVFARDITTKMYDWKHPDTTSMVLQDWIEKVPDWYVSKEGDVVFGALEFLDGRDELVPGTLLNHEDLGTGKYGMKIQASGGSSFVTFKAPDILENNDEKMIRLIATTDGIHGRLGSSTFRSNVDNDYGVDLLVDRKLTLEGKEELKLIGGTDYPTLPNDGSELSVTYYGLNLTNPHRTPKTQDDPFPNNWVQYRFYSNGHIHHQLGNYVFWVVDDDGNMKLTVIGNADYNIGSYNESTGTYSYDSGNVNWRCSKFNVTGDITAGRVFNAVYNDLVEYMEKDDYDEEISAGDVVVFTNDGKVRKPNGNINDVNCIAGIVSSPETMGLILGGEGLSANQKVPVALAGRVYLNTEGLDVQAGDLIALGSDGNLKIVGDYSRAVIGKATKHSAEGKTYVLVK